MTEINWDMLRVKAIDAMQRAYAPYSGFPVGAAGLLDDGRVVVGCNVENVSHGLGLCAECVLVGNLHVLGRAPLVAVTACDARGEVITPCGRCRQVLFEHGGPELMVDHRPTPRPLGQLLPDAFGPDDITAVRGTA